MLSLIEGFCRRGYTAIIILILTPLLMFSVALLGSKSITSISVFILCFVANGVTLVSAFVANLVELRVLTRSNMAVEQRLTYNAIERHPEAVIYAWIWSIILVGSAPLFIGSGAPWLADRIVNCAFFLQAVPIFLLPVIVIMKEILRSRLERTK